MNNAYNALGNLILTPPPSPLSTTTIKITIICTRFGKNQASGDENAVTADHVTTSPLSTTRHRHYSPYTGVMW